MNITTQQECRLHMAIGALRAVEQLATPDVKAESLTLNREHLGCLIELIAQALELSLEQ